jgi:RNA polymerase sigma factor (sigma-70 family)
MSDLSQQLRRIALLPDDPGTSDEELLERFLSRREEIAFAVLVRRHGPMVFGVCRRMLHDYQLAEDAFQATFLVLIRKGTAIRKRESLASWLYGVAYRTARRARATLCRQRSRERPMRESFVEPSAQASWRDVAPILDQEVQRLPEIYRSALVLCDLEGKTRNEAARLLGCPEGTLSTRLMRGRELLAKRLTRRGITLSAGGLGLVLGQQQLSAAPSASLLKSTVGAGVNMAFRQAVEMISPQAAALTEGVVRTMVWTPIIKGVALVLTTGFLWAGFVLSSHRATGLASVSVSAEQQRVAAAPEQRINPVQDPLREKLIRRIGLEKGIDKNTPFKDVIEFLADRYDLTIEIDTGRFKATGSEGVEYTPVSLPRLVHARIATVLRLIAAQVNGICMVTAKKVVIVPQNEKIVAELQGGGYALLPPSPPDEEAQMKAFAVMGDAYRGAIRTLRSGSGAGTFEAYFQRPNDKEATLTHRANFKLHFDHKRYYVDLRYDKNSTGADRQIMIHDNSGVFVSNFQTFARGEVFETGVGSPGTDFPRDPSGMTKPQLDVEQWIANAGDDVHVEELAEGGYTIQVRKGRVRESCTVLARFGWNVSMWKMEIEGQVPYVQQATWKKTANVWYRDTTVELRNTTRGKERSVLRLTDFRPNAAVSPKLFHLAALELPVGAVILDHRDNVERNRRRYQPISDDGSRRLFDMEAELETLPGQ